MGVETFENRQTKWSGLWWHPENGSFSSAVIDLSILQQFKGPVKLYIKKNKYFDKGKNKRPNYNFCIRSCDQDKYGKADNAERNDRIERLELEEKEDEPTIESLKNRIAELEAQMADMYTKEQVKEAFDKVTFEAMFGHLSKNRIR